MEYEKMNPKYKNAWVKKLRSREYKQGKSQLQKDNGSRRCLGVLCHMNKDLFINTNAYLPSDLSEKYNLNHEAQCKLADLNDDGIKFNKIANWIEKNL